MKRCSNRSTLLAPLTFALSLVASSAFAEPTTTLDEVPTSLRVGPSGQPLDEAQTKRLLEGKVICSLTPGQGDDAPKGVAVAIIDAAPAQVFKTLRDYPHFKEYMPHVTSATVDSTTGAQSLVSVRVHGAMGLGDREYQLRVSDEKKTVEGHEVLVSRFEYTGKGNIKASKGEWTLVPFAGGTKTFATFMDHLDPGGSIPRHLKNHEVQKGMEDAMEAVQQHTLAKN